MSVKNTGVKKVASTKAVEKIQRLDSWEWRTLIASWRYFSHGATISAASFPHDIVERFWASGKYSDEALSSIAHQFAVTDYGSLGEGEWTRFHKEGGAFSQDTETWCKFYAFCKAWVEDGFRIVTLEGKEKSGKFIHEEVECFYCEFTKHWYPKKDYIRNPYLKQYAAPEFIKSIARKKVTGE